MENHLIYITQNGTLRTMSLCLKTDENFNILTCKPTEDYLVTGIVYNGFLLNPYDARIDFIGGGLTPTELFLMRSSNKIFFLPMQDYRTQNVPFEFKIEDQKYEFTNVYVINS